MAKAIHAKKRCCQSDPRCKRCPVVCKRLEKLGYAERESKRRWTLVALPPKKLLAGARAR
jgi:hypothetical protein